MSMAALAVMVGSGPSMVLEEDKAEGLIEGSSLTVLNRNLYFNRNYRNGQSSPTGNGYSEAWAQAIINRFESGFTQGTVGVGVDAFAMIGLKLDTGDGRNGGQARDEYTAVGFSDARH